VFFRILSGGAGEAPQPMLAAPRMFHSADGRTIYHFPVRGEMDLHPEAFELVDD
jgi:hypothetical protein